MGTKTKTEAHRTKSITVNGMIWLAIATHFIPNSKLHKVSEMPKRASLVLIFILCIKLATIILDSIIQKTGHKEAKTGSTQKEQEHIEMNEIELATILNYYFFITDSEYKIYNLQGKSIYGCNIFPYGRNQHIKHLLGFLGQVHASIFISKTC
ncbi:hypothetical protein ACJX0J_014367, partial [Zea mays]